jgi:hypothetical protein
MKVRLHHLLLIAVFLAVSGYVHGTWSNRWSKAAHVEGKDLLSGVDGEIGDWRAGEFLQINPADVPAKTKCVSRRFDPIKEGSPLVVSITSGGPGEVAVHTPDVCYLGAGYQLRGAVTRQTIPLDDGKSVSFWVADFVKTKPTGDESIRVRWAWSGDGDWQAPDYPRWVFARVPLLYKLYMVHPLTDDDDLTKSDPYRKFVADLVPALSRQLSR